MSYTTDDCKDFLVTHFSNSKKSEWKRVSKYKDANGAVCRDFINSVTQKTVTLKETPQGLINLTAIQMLLGPSNKTPLNNVLFGGGVTSNSHLLTPEDKFMNVLEHGIDWEAVEGDRSSRDFSKQINFNDFVKEQPDLIFKYIEYIHSAASFILDLDETYMPHHVVSNNFDDSIVDVSHVLDVILKAYKHHRVTIKANKESVHKIFTVFQDINDIADCSDDISNEEIQEVFTEISHKLTKLI